MSAEHTINQRRWKELLDNQSPRVKRFNTGSGMKHRFEDSIARYEAVKKAIALIDDESEGGSSSSSGRLERFHLLCSYLAQEGPDRASIKSPFQLAQLFSLALQHMAPGRLRGYAVQRYELMLATITMNCIMRNSLHYSWERILLRLIKGDLMSQSSAPIGTSRIGESEEGLVSKLYNVALPLLIECAVNDDCIGMKRIDSQYEIIGCSILHFVDELGWTLLHHAVHNKSVRVIKFLITERHFSVNESTEDNNRLSSLHIASSHHHYEVIELLLDLGASRELCNGKNQTPLELLLTSGKSSMSRSSKSLFHCIYYLLTSVDALWSPCAERCILFEICKYCDASVIEEVGTLASQSDPTKWNFDHLVGSMVILLRKGNFACAASLLQKFQDFVFEMTKLPEASKVLSFLLNEVLRSASIQSITLVCGILGPTSNYERLGFLTLEQLCGHINASIVRGDLLLCKHILENILFETDYVYQTYDTQDESPRSERYTSVSPMLLAVHRHDAAVTNLLMTFGDPERLKEASIDLLLGATVSGSIDCLKLLRSALGDVRFYKGLLGRSSSPFSASISPLSVMGNFLSRQMYINIPCKDMMSLFFEVERYVFSSKKVVSQLPGEFALRNNALWEERSKSCAQISQACSEFELEFRKGSNNIFSPKEIKETRHHINNCREYWRLIGPILESKKFTTNMRIAFSLKGDQMMNKISRLLLSVLDPNIQCAIGMGWTTFLKQFPGSKIDKKVSNLQSYLLKFKPQFLSERHIPDPSKPFMNKQQWSHVKSSLMELGIDTLSTINSARLKLKFSSPKQLSNNMLMMWLHSLVIHDDFFYTHDAHGISHKSELLSVTSVEHTKERCRLIEDYHRSLDRSNLFLPWSALSIALLSLLQIFSIDYVSMVHVEELMSSYNEILASAQFQLQVVDPCGIKKIECHGQFQFEEFVYVLIEEVTRFYFGDLDECDEKGVALCFDTDVRDTVVKLFILLLLPITERKLWRASTLLLRNIIAVIERRSYSYNKEQLYRLCTEIICNDSNKKSKMDSTIDLYAARVISPIDFAVENCNIEFLKQFYRLFPESRQEKDVVAVSLQGPNSYVEDLNLSFLFSDNVLDSFEHENSQNVDDEGKSQRYYRISQDIQSWFYEMASNIDANRLNSNLLPGDRYRVSHGSGAASQFKLYGDSSHGLCENLKSEFVLSDGRLLSASKFLKHINNYLFALPTPMAARGQNFGSIYLHTIFEPSVPEYISKFVMEWSSYNNARLRYLSSDREGVTPLYIAIKSVDLGVANKLIKSSTHNSRFSDYVAPGFLSHTSHITRIDLHGMFVDSAVVNSQKSRALLGTISESPSQEEMLSATLQREFAEIRRLWNTISRTDFRQLFTVMYSSRGSNLDSVIQVKMIMSSLGIPTSRLGMDPAETISNPFDALFLDMCPSKLSHFMSFKKAIDIKSSFIRWINLRLVDLSQSTFEAEYLFHRRTDVSLLSLGLLGIRAVQSTSPREREIDYDSLMMLGRSETRILSKQIAEETNTILHYPRFSNNENNLEDGSSSSTVSADSLQHTLKLTYLLLEFFRQLCRARLMLSISNTNMDGKHPLDKVVDNARVAASYEKYAVSTVHALCDEGSNLAMGIGRRFPFFHSLTTSEFCDALHLIIMNDVVDDSISGVLGTIYMTTISLLRLIGEFAISEALVALKKVDSSQSYVQAKFPENTYKALFDVLKSMTIQEVIEADANKSDIDCELMVSHLINGATRLKAWDGIPNFFTSLQTTPSSENVHKYNLTAKQLYSIQCIGSSLVHISAFFPLKAYYLENDVQSLIRRRVVNPLCALCTTSVTTSSKADLTDVCSHLLEIGMKTVEADGNNQVALVVAALLGKAHITSLIFQYISTSPKFEWKLLNGKASTFTDVYFQKSSPFRYMIWNILMMSPPRGDVRGEKIRNDYQQVILTLIKTTNTFSFPSDTPPDACFSCLELAALKQMSDVLLLLCRQVDLFSVGSKATKSAMAHSNRDTLLFGNVSSLRRTFFYVLLSDCVPITTLELLTRNALGLQNVRKAFTVEELWPSDFELSRTIQNHIVYVQRSGIYSVEDDIIKSTDRMKISLISSMKNRVKNAKASYYCNKLLENSASSIDLWDPIYIAIASKEKEKIIHVLQLLLSNIEQEDEYSFPKLLLHVASYYNRVVTVDTYLTQYAPSVRKKIDLDHKAYFDIMREVCTPLDVAIKCSNVASVRTLLSMNCSVIWSHFLHASILGNTEIALLLLTHLESSIPEDDMKYALNDCSSLSEISAKIPQNTTILTNICRRGVEDTSTILLVERLLYLGANVDAVDDYGMTCVNYAASLNCKNLTRVILRLAYDDAHIEATEKLKLEKSLSKLCSLVRRFLLRRHHNTNVQVVPYRRR